MRLGIDERECLDAALNVRTCLLVNKKDRNQFAADEGNMTMSRANWIRIVLIAILVLTVLFVIRLHVAAGQVSTQDLSGPDHQGGKQQRRVTRDANRD